MLRKYQRNPSFRHCNRHFFCMAYRICHQRHDVIYPRTADGANLSISILAADEAQTIHSGYQFIAYKCKNSHINTRVIRVHSQKHIHRSQSSQIQHFTDHSMKPNSRQSTIRWKKMLRNENNFHQANIRKL